MKILFDEATEQRYREEFVGTRGIGCVYDLRCSIRRSCLAFRELFPHDSILHHTHSTAWVKPWIGHLAMRSVGTRTNYLWSLYKWWTWLFERQIIDDNVLEFVSRQKLAVEGVPSLVLRCNLQRHIVEHLDELTRVSSHSRETYAGWLKRFNVFLNRLPEVPAFEDGKLDLGEDVLAAWFHHVCGQYERSTVLQSVNVLNGFLEALVRRGMLAENALDRLRREFPVGRRIGVAYALASDGRGAALRALPRRPMFCSSLAEHLAGFLALQRAIGYRCSHGITVLRDFDRFFVAQGNQGPITSTFLARWRASRPELSAASHRLRWSVLHQFCLYLRRHRPETYVPDPLVGRIPLPRLKAHLIHPPTMRVLLDAVTKVIPGPRWPLRPHTYRTLLVLLYTTGLRISEALHLQVRDVDLRERVITIRETKFYKSRLVPFSDGLLPILRDYQRQRLRLRGVPPPEAPFFVTRNGGHYFRNEINNGWQRLLRHTGLGGGRGRGPRIHDLRHSMASLRLAAWYREGVNVRARLPALATYLGHASIAATQRYLTILPETLLAASERFRRYGGSLIAAAGGDHELA